MIPFFKFIPILKSVLWGGNRIAPYKGLATHLKDIGESWELSGVDGHVSVVASGVDQGLSLNSLIHKYGAGLVGEKTHKQFGDRFPLLIKFIDAKRDLSVQVHPDDSLAMRRHHCLGKTEMWYVIDAEPGAVIHAGLSQPVAPADYERCMTGKNVMNVVAHHESHAGDVFLLPAGRIHAIGAGNLLAEIQQASDVTYRIYDYDRRDRNGNLRELHTELAKDAIDYHVYENYRIAYNHDAKGLTPLVDCPHFGVKRLVVDGGFHLPLECVHSFVVLLCVKGSVQLTDASGQEANMRQGETLLVPAMTSALTFNGHATLLTIKPD